MDWGPGPFGDQPVDPVPERCHDCRGTGANAEAPGDCPTCGGWGTIFR
jgi:DnaJ-class molecular chaperone